MDKYNFITNRQNNANSQSAPQACNQRINERITVNIIQSNIQHSVTGYAALRRTLEEQPNTIALVQEPHLSHGKVSGFNALRGTVLTPPVQRKIRTFIYTPNTFKASLVTHLCTDDLTVAKLETGLQGRLSTILIASAYLDIAEDAPPLH